MTDLECVAKLLGEPWYWHSRGYLTDSTDCIKSDWDIAGACLEKLAEMGLKPLLQYCAPYDHDWKCEVDHGPYHGSISSEFSDTAPAAIIACAAAVYRQTQPIPETDLPVTPDER